MPLLLQRTKACLLQAELTDNGLVDRRVGEGRLLPCFLL